MGLSSNKRRYTHYKEEMQNNKEGKLEAANRKTERKIKGKVVGSSSQIYKKPWDRRVEVEDRYTGQEDRRKKHTTNCRGHTQFRKQWNDQPQELS